MTLLDPLGTLSFMSGAHTPACIANADVNCDGQKNAADVVASIRFSLGFDYERPPTCTRIGDPLPA